jgi:hypothetical protein
VIFLTFQQLFVVSDQDHSLIVDNFQLLQLHLNLLTQQKVAERLGKSRPYIANMLRLLNLPSDIAKLVRENLHLLMQVKYVHGPLTCDSLLQA